jgi:hypothetical protein
MIYVKFNAELHNIDMTKDEVEELRRKLRKFLIGHHPNFEQESNVHVEVDEFAGSE